MAVTLSYIFCTPSLLVSCCKSANAEQFPCTIKEMLNFFLFYDTETTVNFKHQQLKASMQAKNIFFFVSEV